MASVLLLENHPATRDYVAELLRSAGHGVRAALAPEDAWELFAAERPDVVVASLHHPNSAAFVSRARAADTALPVIAIDHGHLGQVRGRPASMRLRPDVYVADVTQRELLEQVAALAARVAASSPQTQPVGTAAVLSRAPALQGQLRDGVLPATAMQLFRAQATGVLVLQLGELERRIFVRSGAPVAFESTERAEALDRWMAEAGRITEAQLAEALRERAGGSLSPAASLVAIGALEPGPPLLLAIREYLQAMLARAVGIRQGRFRFHPGEESLADVQPVEIPALSWLLAGARSNLPLRTFVGSLAADRARFPRRTESFPQLLPQLALVPKDVKLALELNGELATGELLQARKGQLRELASLLWFLRLVDAVAFDDSRAPLTGAPPVVPTEKLKPLPAEELASVRESALKVLPSTYFHALGLDIAATPDELERAYLAVTEQLHPDRFAGFDLAEIEDLLTQVQDKLGAAQRTLSSPEKRQGYLEHIFSRAPELRGGRAISVPAEVALKEAERALKNRRAREAVEKARQAAQLAPKEPEIQAHLALLELLDRSRPDLERRGAALKAARKALQLDPENARAMVCLALLAREERDVSEARKQVLAALKLKPRMELARWLLRELNRVP